MQDTSYQNHNQTGEETREFFEEGESQILRDSAAQEDRIMPVADFHQVHNISNKNNN